LARFVLNLATNVGRNGRKMHSNAAKIDFLEAVNNWFGFDESNYYLTPTVTLGKA